MTNLSNQIYEYYVAHFVDLLPEKQLHFASRLALWSGDAFGKQKLIELRELVIGNDPQTTLEQLFTESRQHVDFSSVNALDKRMPYFEKYADIRVLGKLLFRVAFMKSLYGIDASQMLYAFFRAEQIDAFVAQLLEDSEAIAVLSTYAINILYLYTRFVSHNETLFDPKLFIDSVAPHYNPDSLTDLQLHIYLYTHCIIGESMFYARQIPQDHKATYVTMLQELETLIDTHFERINLDNKFEYLTCSRLLGQDSPLKDRIEAEAAASLSSDGTFLVDTHNSNPQANKTDLSSSEHRNVLYILANREFKPSTTSGK